MKRQKQTYNDGTLNIYAVGNISAEGDMPKEGLTLKVENLRYEERIVGMNRYWNAFQSQVKVERLLRVQLIKEVSSQDVVVPVDGEQYRILQVQYPKDVAPPSMDLSLERIDAAYDFA
ncbi:hypothetical protein [Anaerotalea alkaliphila]|uniref:Uncharacterized protein n=1 Tax=Anaerotalea alkaliphila TaxID=2662126 RepID=A0A7X5HY95_9FIRM|nr:hypothetical protein [Anaerotalea alkaliphila]NDL68850.1 hypothetical protein [Anaerotalea alkaliphila]